MAITHRRSLRHARRHLDRRPVLHVTNGDSLAGMLREAGVQGCVQPWRDVLHDGPVPAVSTAAGARL